MIFQVIHLPLQFLDLQQNLLVFFLLYNLAIKLIGYFVIAEFCVEGEFFEGHLILNKSSLRHINKIQGMLSLVHIVLLVTDLHELDLLIFEFSEIGISS